jgi:adenosine kinase
VPVEKVVDPTGCGDAFRAGMMHGLSRGYDWETTGRIASLMGAIKITHQGGQNHAPSLAEIEERFEQAFGYRF